MINNEQTNMTLIMLKWFLENKMQCNYVFLFQILSIEPRIPYSLLMQPQRETQTKLEMRENKNRERI